MEALTYFCPPGVKICVIFEFILIFPLFFFFCDFRGIFMRFSIHMFLLHCFFEIFHGSVSPSRSDFMAWVSFRIVMIWVSYWNLKIRSSSHFPPFSPLCSWAGARSAALAARQRAARRSRECVRGRPSSRRAAAQQAAQVPTRLAGQAAQKWASCNPPVECSGQAARQAAHH